MSGIDEPSYISLEMQRKALIDEAKTHLDTLNGKQHFKASDLAMFWNGLLQFSQDHQYESVDIGGMVRAINVQHGYFLEQSIENVMFVGHRHILAGKEKPKESKGAVYGFKSKLAETVSQREAIVYLHRGLEEVILRERNGEQLEDIVHELDGNYVINSQLPTEPGKKRGRPPKNRPS